MDDFLKKSNNLVADDSNPWKVKEQTIF
jgi:hypothetical protein